MAQCKFLVVKPNAQGLIHEEEHIKASVSPERAASIVKESGGLAEIYTSHNLCLSYNDDTISGDELILYIKPWL